MGGHGGLNILPQKRWNVYNFDNREKVRKDEEAAAREEQLNREQSRRRDSEFRVERLRQARGLPSSLDTAPEPAPVSASVSAPVSASTQSVASDSRHINLFDGLQDFSSLGGGSEQVDGNKSSKRSRTEEADGGGSRSGKKWRKEEGPAPTVTPEDEKYRLGYGLAGKGVKAPWYLSRAPSLLAEDAGGRGSSASADGSGKKNGGKKTIEELREERMKREKREKERERALFASPARKGEHRGFSRRKL